MLSSVLHVFLPSCPPLLNHTYTLVCDDAVFFIFLCVCAWSESAGVSSLSAVRFNQTQQCLASGHLPYMVLWLCFHAVAWLQAGMTAHTHTHTHIQTQILSLFTHLYETCKHHLHLHTCTCTLMYTVTRAGLRYANILRYVQHTHSHKGTPKHKLSVW